MYYKIKELHKLITTLKNEEGLSDYGESLLDGYAIGLETILKDNAVLSFISHNSPDKNGWSFDYLFIQRIADRARQYEDGISMEDVNAILLSLVDEQVKLFTTSNVVKSLDNDSKWVCQKCGEIVEDTNVTFNEYKNGIK